MLIDDLTITESTVTDIRMIPFLVLMLGNDLLLCTYTRSTVACVYAAHGMRLLNEYGKVITMNDDCTGWDKRERK